MRSELLGTNRSTDANCLFASTPQCSDVEKVSMPGDLGRVIRGLDWLGAVASKDKDNRTKRARIGTYRRQRCGESQSCGTARG